MGLLQRLFGSRSIENPRIPITSQDILQIFGTGTSTAGVAITEKNALRNVAVLACVRILAETPASLPLIIYRRLSGGGKERAGAHPTYTVLHDMANPEMTAMTLRETIQAHAVTWGNGYAYIIRQHGWVSELWPLLPDKTHPTRINGELVYRVYLPSGEMRILDKSEVLHIQGLGYDGLRGYSPIHLAREAIGLGLAAEEFGSRFFGQGTNLGGIVEHPGKLGDQAYKNLKTSLDQKHQGLSKSHLLLILEEGMKYQKMGIAPNDAQFLESRKYQTNDIARLFRIPPHMIGDLEKATFGNIEHQSIDFVTHTLRPWLVRWEQAINHKLFTPQERKKYFAEHLVDGLLRGDAKSRAEALSTLRQNGIINADEWRAIENMNPQADGTGKVYLVNSAMIAIPTTTTLAPASPDPEKKNMVRAYEQRTADANKRAKMAAAFKPAFADIGLRIVRREKTDILKVGIKTLSDRNLDRLDRWLEDFYSEALVWITRMMTPISRSLAASVSVLALEEISSGIDLAKDVDEVVTDHVRVFATRYTSSSLGQLRQVVRRAIEENVDIEEALSTRLNEWEERRPDKVASNETVSLCNRVAMTVFAGAGVSRLRWVNTGSKACPYCMELDGKTISVGRSFVGSDEVLKTDDGKMRLYQPTMHPPLHQACDCQLVPG